MSTFVSSVEVYANGVIDGIGWATGEVIGAAIIASLLAAFGLSKDSFLGAIMKALGLTAFVSSGYFRLFTWAIFSGLVGFLAWMALPPGLPSAPVGGFSPTPPGFSQRQVDEKVSEAVKPLKSQLDEAKAQLDQANKSIENLRQSTTKQIADAIARTTAQFQTQTETPVGVDKLPTSLRLLFKGNDFEVLDLRNVLSAKGLFVWRERKTLLGTQPYPGMAIIVDFKKPVAYSEAHIDDHGAGISTPELTINNPHFAVLTFDSVYYSGLADITFTNDGRDK